MSVVAPHDRVFTWLVQFFEPGAIPGANARSSSGKWSSPGLLPAATFEGLQILLQKGVAAHAVDLRPWSVQRRSGPFSGPSKRAKCARVSGNGWPQCCRCRSLTNRASPLLLSRGGSPFRPMRLNSPD